LDIGSMYYNELCDLLDHTHVLGSWDELQEVITKARSGENDSDTWFAGHGRSTISLDWSMRKES